MRIDNTDPAAPKLVADVAVTIELTETREKIAGARAQAAALREQAAGIEAWADAAQAELNVHASTIAEYEALKAARVPPEVPAEGLATKV